MNQLERTLILLARVLDALEPPQELRARRVQIVVLIELEPVRKRKGCFYVARFGHRDGSVELYDRRPRQASELLVKGRDLPPILRLIGVQSGDRGLEDVGAAPAERQGTLELRTSFSQLLEVPQRSILIAKQDHGAVGKSGLAARVVRQHQRQESVDLGLVRHELGEGSAKPDRLRSQVCSAAVSLVEDQVHDREHGGEAVGEQMRRRHTEGDSGVPDLVLRADEPFGHGLLGDEESAGDLLGAQATERSQRKRNLRIERERGVATREHELEPLIRNRRIVHFVLHGLGHVEQMNLRGEGAIATDAVDGAVASGGHEPSTRIVGRAFSGPTLGGGRERLLRGFLGELEVVEKTDQRSEDAPPLVAEDVLERYRSTTGRTSTAPPMRAAGTRAANSTAASRSLASKKK